MPPVPIARLRQLEPGADRVVPRRAGVGPDRVQGLRGSRRPEVPAEGPGLLALPTRLAGAQILVGGGDRVERLITEHVERPVIRRYLVPPVLPPRSQAL